MQLRIGSIVIHCHQFDRMVDFWQKALGYLPREPASNGWCVLRDPGGKYPNVSFQARETRRPGRNWIHLDLYTDNQTTEVARLESLGARRSLALPRWCRLRRPRRSRWQSLLCRPTA